MPFSEQLLAQTGTYVTMIAGHFLIWYSAVKINVPSSPSLPDCLFKLLHGFTLHHSYIKYSSAVHTVHWFTQFSGS